MSKYLSVKYLPISKQTSTLSWAIKKKLIFGGSIWGVLGGVAPPNYVKIFVCQIFADITKYWHSSLGCSKMILGGPFGGISRGVAPPKYVKIIVCWISADIIKHWHSKLSHSKNWFLGGPFGGVPGGDGPPNYVKTFASQISSDIKKTSSLAWAVKELIFWGPILGGFRGSCLKKIREKKLRCSSTTSHKN